MHVYIYYMYTYIYIYMYIYIFKYKHLIISYLHMDDFLKKPPTPSTAHPRLRHLATIPGDGTSQVSQVQVLVPKGHVGDLQRHGGAVSFWRKNQGISAVHLIG